MNKLLFSFLFLFLFVFQSFSQNQYNQIGVLNDFIGAYGDVTAISDDGRIVASIVNAAGGGIGVRVNQYSNNTWTQLGQEIGGWGTSFSNINSISLSKDGTTLAIGSECGGVECQGIVRVYKYENNTWSQLGQDIYGEQWTDYSGASISLSKNGRILAIGATQRHFQNNKKGYVRVYRHSGGINSNLFLMMHE